MVLKSNGKGVSTAADGTFTLSNVNEGAPLLVKFLGYNQKEIVAAKLLGNIRMEPTQNPLDEVQIQAYGKTSRRLSLANITSVKAKDIENQVVSNPLLALQGRVAGLRIQQVSGNVGATVNVNIQGTSSLKGSSVPFYVVDGVPYPGSTIEGTGNPQVWGRATPSLQRESSGSPLTYLNPSDIESIEVLKDADATAIYGSRAANGAIIITTKKGKPGALRIDLTAQSGWDKVPQITKFLNTEEYLEIRREAYANANQIVEPGTYDLDGTWDQTRYTDWQKELIKTQNYSNANLSVSGGSINSNYRVALTANRQGSPYGQDFRNDNVALSTSLNSASANQKFKMSLVANYLNGQNSLPSLSSALPGGGIISLLSPNAPAVYNPDGSVNWAINADGVTTFPLNPIPRFLTNPYEVKTNNLTSNLDLSYNIFKGFDLSTSIGYNRAQQQEFSADLLATYPPADQIYVQRSGSLRFTQSNSLIVEPKVSYGLQFGAHRIKALLGTTYNRSQAETSGIVGYGQNSDSQVRNLAAASSFSQTGAFYQEYRYNAIFSRLEYSFKDRYLFNLSIRRDGSARFGPANRFGNFGSVAAGWIISEERWLKENATWLDFLKLRSSYGITGSDAVGDYSFMDLYSSATVGVPYQGIVGLSPRGLLNKELQWEEKNQ
ncbi:SusC/RagA family TonB-linked outer membrane protein [Pedobacter sp. P26]|uniref:SusC/RagA family TonB-linked outer membrane protein n=1 Tax=Pedobacter sp. P26 TaxID=3423956 RepID=UPI003D676DEF